MTKNNSFASRLTAATSALMLSLVLIGGTVTNPQPASATTTVTIGDAA